jgi:hypothetical protein
MAQIPGFWLIKFMAASCINFAIFGYNHRVLQTFLSTITNSTNVIMVLELAVGQVNSLFRVRIS